MRKKTDSVEAPQTEEVAAAAEKKTRTTRKSSATKKTTTARKSRAKKEDTEIPETPVNQAVAENSAEAPATQETTDNAAPARLEETLAKARKEAPATKEAEKPETTEQSETSEKENLAANEKAEKSAAPEKPAKPAAPAEPVRYGVPPIVIRDIVELIAAPQRQLILNDQQIQQMVLEDAQKRFEYIELTLACVLDYDVVLSDTNMWLELQVGKTSSHSDPRVNARLQFERQLEFISKLTKHRGGRFMMMSETYEEIDRFATQQEPVNYKDADWSDESLCRNAAARLAKRLILSQQRENRLRIEGIGAESHHSAFADPAIIRRTVELFAQGKKVLLLTNDASVAIRSMGMCDDLQRHNNIDDATWDRDYAPLRPMVMTMDDMKVLDTYTRQYHFLQMAAGAAWMQDVPTSRKPHDVQPLELWLEGFRPGDRRDRNDRDRKREKQNNQQNQNGQQNNQQNNQQAKQEQQKQEQQKQQQKQEQPKQPKQEPKSEQPKQQPKQEQHKQEPKQEQKAEQPKQEPKAEQPKQQKEPKAEQPKQQKQQKKAQQPAETPADNASAPVATEEAAPAQAEQTTLPVTEENGAPAEEQKKPRRGGRRGGRSRKPKAEQTAE